MKTKTFGWIAAAFLLAGMIFGCVGEDGELSLPGGGVSLTITPKTPTIEKGGTETFSVSITGLSGATPAVTWELSGNKSTDTKFSGNGLKVAEDETNESFSVRAKLMVSGKLLATATATVTVSGNGGLTVSPGVVVIGTGNTQTFTAALSGGGDAGAVTWSLEDGTTNDSTVITEGGVLTVDAGETAEKLVVKATQTAGNKYGTAIVYVGNTPDDAGHFPENHGITVNPQQATVVKGGQKLFSQTGATSVEWLLDSYTGSESTIAGGLLTVGADETAEKLVVKATGSGADASKWGAAVVTVAEAAGPDNAQPEALAIPFSGNSAIQSDSVIDLIKAAAGPQSLSLTLTAETEPEPVTLTAVTDLGTTGLVLDNTTSPASVTIDGGGRVIDLKGSATGNPLITVGNGVTLTLRNITFKGLSTTDNDSNSNNASLVNVVSGGALVLETGAVIAKNDVPTNISVHGLGVRITGTGATFTMYDGSEVRDNKGYTYSGGTYGGGVCAENGGTFNMEGGLVTGNVARRGAVAARNSAVVNLRGGSISGNSANYGGGIAAGTNGNDTGGIVNMYGGSVSGNSSNDIWIFCGEFYMYGGYVENLMNENCPFTIQGPITWNGVVAGNVTLSGDVTGSGTMSVSGTVYTKGFTYSGLNITAGTIDTTP